jgi:single-stranded DNA-specific DHH superfamily exonuclease
VTVIAWWGRGYAEPIFLVTNFELPDEAFIGIKSAFKSKPFSPTRKAVVFIS